MGQSAADLFEYQPARPLADRMRPVSLDAYLGQEHILGPGKPLRKAIESGHLHSMLFWGPPGTGKTTLARILSDVTSMQFLSLSAVMAGVKDIRLAVQQARDHQSQNGHGTVLFIDEIHRFNKSQQDGLLPYVEDGTVTLIGATTENPSFELNNALLSRVRVYVLKSLQEETLLALLKRALDHDSFFTDKNLSITEKQLLQIAQAADGDARRALGFLELAAELSDNDRITEENIAAVISGGARRFDKGGEYFYDQISALHKSVRGSDPDAALYWFARMVDGGCDPRYIARRVLRIATEDIGLADPRAQELAIQGWQSYERLGSPEGELAIAQAIVYMACAPKSNAVYTAYKAAMSDVQESGSLEVPLHLRNAPTKLMKELNYGKAYRYAHDEEGGYAAGENYFPEKLEGRCYYKPVDRGLEIRIAEKLRQLREKDMSATQKEKN